MDASRPLGIGIVGIGMIAGFHAKAIKELKGARLVGVAGRDEARTRAFAATVEAPFSTTDVSSLVSRSDLDILCVTTPSGAHLEAALEAIRAGKHVVVEKPIEITTERSTQMIDAANEAGVYLCPIFQARFGDGARAVKAAIDAGRLGKLVLCSAYVKWHRGPSYYRNTWKGSQALDGGGALMNQGIHAVDLLQWFAGMPASVTGFTTRRVHTGIEAEDTAVGALRFASGALGTLEASTAAFPGWSRRLEICGETGSVCLEDDKITKWDFVTAQPGDEGICTPKPGDALGSGAGAANAINFEGHRRQLQDLVDALRSKGALAIDGAQARNAVAIIRALYRSAATGQPASP